MKSLQFKQVDDKFRMFVQVEHIRYGLENKLVELENKSVGLENKSVELENKWSVLVV